MIESRRGLEQALPHFVLSDRLINTITIVFCPRKKMILDIRLARSVLMGKLSLLWYAMFAIPIASAQAEEDYAQRWARLANEHLAMVREDPGKSYERDLISTQNTFWPDVSKKCKARAEKAGIDKFADVAVLDSDDAIVELLTLPESEELACYVKQTTGRRYPPPPSTPFYEVITVKPK